MAYVGAVYTIDRFPRTTDQVLDEMARRERSKDRPRPQHKRVWAEMTRIVDFEIAIGLPVTFAELNLHNVTRDRLRLAVAYRMIALEARTRTIRLATHAPTANQSKTENHRLKTPDPPGTSWRVGVGLHSSILGLPLLNASPCAAHSVTLSCTSRVTFGSPDGSETSNTSVYSPVSGSAARLIELA